MDVSSREESVTRSAVFALAVQVTTAAFTAILTLYLTRALGPDGFGVFSLALATGGLIAIPGDLGVSAATARFVAERRGDRARVAQVISAGFTLKIVTSALLGVVVFAASHPIASAYNNERLTWPLRGVAFSFFGQTMMLFFRNTFAAQAKIAPNLRIQVVESSIETAASMALVAVGTGATGATFGRAAGYLVGAALALVMTARFAGRPAVAFTRGLGEVTRRIIRYAGPLTIVDSAYLAFSQIDVILIGLLLNASAVGLFQAPNRFTTFLAFPAIALGSAVAPRLAGAAGRARSLRPLNAALRYLVILQAICVTPTIVWAKPIVGLLLGDRYGRSAEVLRILAPYVFLIAISPVVSQAANYLGVARRRVPIVLATVALNVAIDIVLIPRIGIIAGAIGTDIAYTFYVLGHFWICKTAADLPLRPILLTMLRATIAAGAMAAVLAAVGTSDLSAAGWAVGAVGGTLAFGAVLLLTKEVSRSEVAAAWDFARRRLPARARA